MRVMSVLVLLVLALAAMTVGAQTSAASQQAAMQSQAAGGMYGIVTSVNPARNRFMISTSHRVIYVTPTTRLMRNGQSVALSDLHTGMGVTVIAQRSGSRLIASRVDLGRAAVAGAAMGEMRGIVTSVNPQANRLMISTSNRVIYVNPSTRILQDNQEVPLSQVHTGMHVVIATRMVGNRLVASSINLSPAVAGPQQRQIMGRVASVDTRNNTVTLESGETLHLSAQTQIMCGDRAMQLSDLQPGQQVTIVLHESNGRMLADRITWSAAAVAGTEQRQVAGTISSIDLANNTFTLDSGQVIHVDASTKLMRGDQPLALSDLQSGQQVQLSVTPMAEANNWHAVSVQVMAEPEARQPEASAEPETSAPTY